MTLRERKEPVSGLGLAERRDWAWPGRSGPLRPSRLARRAMRFRSVTAMTMQAWHRHRHRHRHRHQLGQHRRRPRRTAQSWPRWQISGGRAWYDAGRMRLKQYVKLKPEPISSYKLEPIWADAFGGLWLWPGSTCLLACVAFHWPSKVRHRICSGWFGLADARLAWPGRRTPSKGTKTARVSTKFYRSNQMPVGWTTEYLHNRSTSSASHPSQVEPQSSSPLARPSPARSGHPSTRPACHQDQVQG